MKIEKPKSKQPFPENAKLVFKGAIFDVYQWEQELYNGNKAIFEKLKRPDTVLIIPVTEDGKIIMSYQEQPGKAPFTGTIGGRVDEGEDALEAAKRELLEESGYEAREWVVLDAFQPVSKIEWAIYVFIAKGCKKVAEQSLDGGEKIELRLVDFDEFVEIVLDEKFGDMEMRVRFLEAKLELNKMTELRKIIME